MNTKTLIAAVTLVAATMAASVAQAHGKIESSQPKADSELQSPPKEIRLQFNEALEPAFSKIELSDAKNAKVTLAKAEIDKTNHKVMFAAVPALQPGQYRVRWSTMTHDGHKTKGQFAFRVK
jgi:methionine-rich copper-binding protein CopC